MAQRRFLAITILVSFLRLTRGVPAQAPDGFRPAGCIPSWPPEAGGAVLPGTDPLLALADSDGISLLRREGGGGAWLPEGRVEASAYGLEGIRVEGAFHRFASQWLLLFTARGPDGGRGLWALVDPGRGNPASVMSLCGGRAGAGDPSWTAVRAEGGRAVFVSAAEGSLEALILGPAPSWTARRATEPAIPSARVLDAFLCGDRCVAVLGGKRNSELLLLDLAADQPRWERVAAAAAVSDMAFLGRSGRPGQEALAFGNDDAGILLAGWGADWKADKAFGPGLRAWVPFPGIDGGLSLSEGDDGFIIEGAIPQPLALGRMGADASLSPWIIDGRACLIVSAGGRALRSVAMNGDASLRAVEIEERASPWMGRSGPGLLQEALGIARLVDGSGTRAFGFSGRLEDARALLVEGELLWRAGEAGGCLPPVPLSIGYSRLGRIEEGRLLAQSLDGGGRPRFLALDDGAGGAFLFEAEDRP